MPIINVTAQPIELVLQNTTERIDIQVVDAAGTPVDATGLYTRTWTINWNVNVGDLIITVNWLEGGSEPHSFVYRTKRFTQ